MSKQKKYLLFVVIFVFSALSNGFGQTRPSDAPKSPESSEKNTEFSELIRSAESGDVESQYALGVMYNYGLGMDKDPVEAANWYRKAAEQGHADAQFQLGLLYHFGIGMNRDQVKTAKWLRKAAEQDHAKAQLLLGAMYAKGEGVDKNQVEAANWYQKAAEQGDVEAQVKGAVSILRNSLIVLCHFKNTHNILFNRCLRYNKIVIRNVVIGGKFIGGHYRAFGAIS